MNDFTGKFRNEKIAAYPYNFTKATSSQRIIKQIVTDCSQETEFLASVCDIERDMDLPFHFVQLTLCVPKFYNHLYFKHQNFHNVLVIDIHCKNYTETYNFVNNLIQ